MKLLLRANSHQPFDGWLEIASPPDTPHRDRWQWHLRTAASDAATAGDDTVCIPLQRGDTRAGELRLTIDPGAIGADVESFDVTDPVRISRSHGCAGFC